MSYNGFGSFQNGLAARATRGQPDPFVGMGVTILLWTDRLPGEIVGVEKTKDGWLIDLVEVKYKVVSGSAMDGSAVYEYGGDEGQPRQHWRFSEKKPVWERVVRSQDKLGRYRWKATGCRGLRLGEKNAYRDPSF